MILLGIACGYFCLGWFLFLVGYFYLAVQHPEKLSERMRDYFDRIDIVEFIGLAISFSFVWGPTWIKDAIKSRRKKCSKEQ